ncbi:hypothetical protein Tco_0071854 [Tanacetum coccineum]
MNINSYSVSTLMLNQCLLPLKHDLEVQQVAGLLTLSSIGASEDDSVGLANSRGVVIALRQIHEDDWEAMDFNGALSSALSVEGKEVLSEDRQEIFINANDFARNVSEDALTEITIVIPDSDETLMLCEESRSKMLLKEQDPMVVKNKVNTKPINYAVLNNDYNKRFVRQSDLYSEHAYWKATSVPPLDPSPSSTTNKVEVPKEFPKVSMVNTSLKELKRHLAGFDQVVKERTTAIAITEGTWGFEHTKACFRDEIIPFIKELKDIFNNFNQYLVDELADVQNVFYQMEHAVEQHRLESKTFEVKMNQVVSPLGIDLYSLLRMIAKMYKYS